MAREESGCSPRNCFDAFVRTGSRTGSGLGCAACRDDAGGGTFRGRVACRASGGAGRGGRAARRGLSGMRHGIASGAINRRVWQTGCAVPHARLTGEDGGSARWRSSSLRACQRRHPGRRRLDRRGLSRRDQHRRIRRTLKRGVSAPVGQDVGQPRLAQDEGRLGRLEVRARSRRSRYVRLILDGTVARRALEKNGDLRYVARHARRARNGQDRCSR